MPEWRGECILLSVKPHGENNSIASIFSRNHGRYSGLVFGGNSSKNKSLFQKGNYLSACWNARLSEQLGTFKFNLEKSIAAKFINNPLQLAALNSVCCTIDSLLPEREPNFQIFDATIDLFNVINMSTTNNHKWLEGYIRWEIGLLSKLGFSLQLNECIVSKVKNNLAFVSPKTGNAVCYSEGFLYKDKLLTLPKFLGGNYKNKEISYLTDLRDGFKLSGYFLNSNFVNNSYKDFFSTRDWFYGLVLKLKNSSKDNIT